MTDLAAVVAADVALVESPRNPRSVPAGATITAGMVVRMNTSARLVGADGSAAGTADAIGIALKGGPAGTAISSRIVGWCIPAFGNTTADKLLRVDGALPG
jgi:hypothetical protein